MQLICPDCKQEFRSVKTDVRVVVKAGTPAHPVSECNADLYRCPGCAQEVITGCGQPLPYNRHGDGRPTYEVYQQ